MSKKEKVEKSNVMRLLEQHKVAYVPHEYDPEKALSGKEVAEILGEEPDRVFKTLVTVGKSGEHYVFFVPGEKELNLKKAAKVSSEKFIEMIPQKELLPLTGYIHGGCSPVGMKKKFMTFIDISATSFDTIFVSGGKRGLQVEVNPQELASMIEASFEDIAE